MDFTEERITYLGTGIADRAAAREPALLELADFGAA